MFRKAYVLGCMLLVITLVIPGIYCGKTNPVDKIIPYVLVNFTINPNSIKYNNLNIVGNWTYVSGGYSGIIIFHSDINEYKAFERTSPYDFPNDFNCRVNVDESGLIAVDNCSGSKYILLDGTPFEGPATLPLKQYNTYFDGVYLHVYN
ncbi:MAG: hypothetical protein GY834_14275 [Bacteroidetes bacterium]|nr:hypothetical protein [Bacteroidota bacterium]